MRVLAAVTGLILLLSPLAWGASKPGLVAEYQATETVLFMGLAHDTRRIEVRDDRSRIEYRVRSDVGISGSKEEVRIEIVRPDRGVHWVVYPDTRSYEEYPWPDTARPKIATRPPGPGDAVAEMPDSIRKLRSKRQSGPRHVSLAPDRPTIHGFATKHYVVRLDPELPAAGVPQLDFGGAYDLWIATDLRDEAEILRLMDVLDRHDRLSQPAKPMSAEGTSPGDSIRGVPVRTWIRMRIVDPAELAKRPPADTSRASKDRERGFDARTGMVTLLDNVMTSAHLAPIADEEFELPAGYKKLETHSPR